MDSNMIFDIVGKLRISTKFCTSHALCNATNNLEIQEIQKLFEHIFGKVENIKREKDGTCVHRFVWNSRLFKLWSLLLEL